MYGTIHDNLFQLFTGSLPESCTVIIVTHSAVAADYCTDILNLTATK